MAKFVDPYRTVLWRVLLNLKYDSRGDKDDDQYRIMQGLDVALPRVSAKLPKRQVFQAEHSARTFGPATARDHRQQTSTVPFELVSPLFARTMSDRE
jgi:hypothetical protein